MSLRQLPAVVAFLVLTAPALTAVACRMVRRHHIRCGIYRLEHFANHPANRARKGKP